MFYLTVSKLKSQISENRDNTIAFMCERMITSLIPRLYHTLTLFEIKTFSMIRSFV